MTTASESVGELLGEYSSAVNFMWIGFDANKQTKHPVGSCHLLDIRSDDAHKFWKKIMQPCREINTTSNYQIPDAKGKLTPASLPTRRVPSCSWSARLGDQCEVDVFSRGCLRRGRSYHPSRLHRDMLYR